MEKDKTKSWITALIIFLILIIILLGAYIVYDKCTSKNKVNNNETNSKNIIVSVEPKEDVKNGIVNELVINGKTIKYNNKILDYVMFIDKEHIIAAYKEDEGIKSFYIYNKDGKELYDVSKLSSLNNGIIVDAYFSDNELIIGTVTKLFGDNYNALCSLKQTDTYKKVDSLKYLGNGKFDDAETIGKLTVKDYLKANYNYTCE